jgi:hypothetical protein
MITNDAELQITRERLGLVEAALDSLRRDVKSKNERLYALMAESYIDLLLSIRGDIDAYLGIAPYAARAAGKEIEVEGVIRSIDLDAQTFVLGERPDSLPDLPCEYGLQTEDVVKEFLDRRVIVSGALQTSRLTHKDKLEAEAINLVSAEEQPAAEQPATSNTVSSPA